VHAFWCEYQISIQKRIHGFRNYTSGSQTGDMWLNKGGIFNPRLPREALKNSQGARAYNMERLINKFTKKWICFHNLFKDRWA